MTVSPQVSQLASYISTSGPPSLPDDVAWRAKQHFLDALASIVSGSVLRAGLLGLKWLDVAFPGAPGPCTLLGTDRTGPAIAIALANGMSAHAGETDDSHAPSLSHPGCSIASTVFAVAEESGSSGADVLRAVVVGYDVGCRVGRATQSAERVLSLGKWSSHAMVGTFCSAAAAGSLNRFSEEQVRYLLGYASQLSSGNTSYIRDPSHVQKAFVLAAMPAHHGVLAASMVRAGCDGVDDVFSGERNFLHALSSAPELDKLASGLGTEFEVMQTTIKKLPVGSPAQAALEAISELITKNALLAGEVNAITIHLPAEGARTVDGRAMLNINVQYLVAGTVVDGGFSLAMSHDEKRLHDPAIIEMMSRIQLVVDESFGNERFAKVVVERRRDNGTETLESTVHDVRGTPRNPMSFDEVRVKAIDLIAGVLGADRADRACSLIANLENLLDLHELAEVLGAP